MRYDKELNNYILQLFDDNEEHSFNYIYSHAKEKYGQDLSSKKVSNILYRNHSKGDKIISVRRGFYKKKSSDVQVKERYGNEMGSYSRQKFIEDLKKIADQTNGLLHRIKVIDCFEDRGKYEDSKWLYDSNKKLELFIQVLEHETDPL